MMSLHHSAEEEGDRLPGEHDLCQIFGVSRPVVRQAIQDLCCEGLLVRRHGKGTFVATPRIAEKLAQKLTGFYQDMREHGRETVSKVSRQKVVKAPPKVAAALGSPTGGPVIRIDRLRFAGEIPMVWVRTCLPHPRCACA